MEVKKRCAIYIRVSTEEQHLNGLSLPAQRKALEDYAATNGYHVAGVYADEGISARKSMSKRKELMCPKDFLCDVIVFDAAEPTIQLCDQNHIDFILSDIVQEPHEFFTF